MWVRVQRCDEKKKIVFGTLDSEPVNDYNARVRVGTDLAIAYAQIREHRKASEFRAN
jgi:hypothetical protein